MNTIKLELSRLENAYFSRVQLDYNADLIKEHANKGGFPANSISEVKNIISPKTAD